MSYTADPSLVRVRLLLFGLFCLLVLVLVLVFVLLACLFCGYVSLTAPFLDMWPLTETYFVPLLRLSV